MISISHITKEYSDGISVFRALDDVSVEIGGDERFVSFVGASGSGKTTLFNIIGLLDVPTSGVVTVDGLNVAEMSMKEVAKFRNRRIGYIFQSFFLDDSYDVRMNVEMPLIIAGISKVRRKKRVSMALDLVGLSKKAYSKVANLSGGERQRVSIARAIVNNPSIILADEPCGNLDTANGEKIMGILSKLANAGKMVLLITHNPLHASYAQRVLTLSDGKIVKDAIL